VPRRKRHIIAGIAWVVASLIAWAWICRGAILVLMYLVNERHVHLAEVIFMGFDWIQIGGIMIIPPVMPSLQCVQNFPGRMARGWSDPDFRSN